MTAGSCVVATSADAQPPLIDALRSRGATSVVVDEQADGRRIVHAGFGDDVVARGLVAELRSTGVLAVTGPASSGQFVGWKRRTAPTVFGAGACICFPWSSFDRSAFDLIVEIDPGAGFGAGNHPSTLLLLEWLVEHDVSDRRILDVGCGSGVLAVVAARRGASDVVAIDIAPGAVAAAARNATLNGVAAVVQVSTMELSTVRGPFDVVLANIHAPVLTAMAPDFRRLLAPTGSLALSGLSRAQVSRVAAAMSPLCSAGSTELDDWVSVTFR